jgi:hypothetical protein
MVRFSKGLVLVFVFGCVGPAALAQEAEAESCVGKVRLHGPLWDLQSGALEPAST